MAIVKDCAKTAQKNKKEAINNVTFTSIEKSVGPCTKVIGLDENGNLKKDSSRCHISEGSVETITIPFSNFPSYVLSLEKNMAIIHGTMISGETKQKILSRKKFKDQPETITRTKEYFEYSENQNCLTMLDSDPVEGQEYFPPEKLIEILSSFIPGFSSCAKILNYSTSSHIYDEAGNLISNPNPGYHLYIVVKNGSDIKRFADILFKLLWLNGYGYILIAKDGGQNPRTPVDKSVFSPERLDFVSGAVCKDGLTQKLPDPEYIPGDVLDTSLLKDLSPEQEKEYQDLVEEKKQETAGQAKKIKEAYKKDEIKKLGNRKIPLKRAETIVSERQKGILIPGEILHFDDLGAVDVADVLINPEDYDGETLADPLEPDYGGGGNKAIFYANEDQNRPVIHSFAHCGKKYVLENKWTVETVMQKLHEKILKEKIEHDYWTKVLFLADLGPADTQDVIDFLVANKVGQKRTLSLEWKKQCRKLQEIELKKRTNKQGKTLITYSELNIYEATSETDKALIENKNIWGYYKYAGRLSYIVQESPPKMHSLEGADIPAPKIPMIKIFDEEILRLEIEKCAIFQKMDKDGFQISIPAPDVVIATLLKFPDSSAPRIEGLVFHPFISPSGKLVITEGLDDLTGLLVSFGGSDFNFPDKKYTLSDSKLAVERIKTNLLSEFEWKKKKLDEIVAIGFLLTSIQRKILQSAPAVLITASTPSAGKTTLARMIHLIITGCDMPVTSLSDTNAQDAKKEMLSLLLCSMELICFDNVQDGMEIKDPILAKVITSPIFMGRKLGGHDMPKLLTNVAIVITGNNISLSSDLVRRFITINLEPKSAEPEKRIFEQSDVIEQCIRNRPEIIQDALTVIKAYLDAGCPLNGKKASSGFPDWDRLVRLPLLHATDVDIMDSIQSNRLNSGEIMAMETVISCLALIYGGKTFRAKDVCDLITNVNGDELKDEFIGLLEGIEMLKGSSDLSPLTIGIVFKKMKNRIFQNSKLCVNTNPKKGNSYYIQQMVKVVTDCEKAA